MIKFHLYRSRHIFQNDDCIGKYNSLTKTIHLLAGFEHYGDAVKAWFKRTLNIYPKAVAGPETLEAIAPLIELPDFVLDLMTPHQGDRTPAVIQWCRENHAPADFHRRYGAELPYQVAVEQEDASTFPDPIVPGSSPIDPLGITLFSPPHDDEDEDLPSVITEGTADFPQGGPDTDDDDFADTDVLAGIVVKEQVAAPTLEVLADSAEVKAPPAVTQEGTGPIYTLKGAEILHKGQVIAELYGEEKQLRMRANQSPHKAAVRAFLDAQFRPPTP